MCTRSTVGQHEGGGGSCVQTYYRLQVCRTHTAVPCDKEKRVTRKEKDERLFFSIFITMSPMCNGPEYLVHLRVLHIHDIHTSMYMYTFVHLLRDQRAT